MNKIKFIKAQIDEIKGMNGHLEDYSFPPARNFIPIIDQVEVECLSQKDIDEHAEDYPEYAEALVADQPAYYDGECYWPDEYIDEWLAKTIKELREINKYIDVDTGLPIEFLDDEVIIELTEDYIKYKYANLLVEPLLHNAA